MKLDIFNNSKNVRITENYWTMGHVENIPKPSSQRFAASFATCSLSAAVAVGNQLRSDLNPL